MKAVFLAINSYFSSCNECNGTGKVIGLGLIEKICTSCKYRRKIKLMGNTIYSFILNNPFKIYPVHISIAFCIVSLIFLYFYENQISITVFLASFAAIYNALKYRLDQANYNKNLFEDRYKIFKVIDEVLWGYAENLLVTEEMQTKINLDLMRRSYFLFNKSTYKFILDFRQSLLDIKFLDDSKIQQDFESKERLRNARYFLNLLVDRQNLSVMFPEMKINIY